MPWSHIAKKSHKLKVNFPLPFLNLTLRLSPDSMHSFLSEHRLSPGIYAKTELCRRLPVLYHNWINVNTVPVYVWQAGE